MLSGHKRLRTQEVLSLLAARDRATYGSWTFERLADALPEEAKPYKSAGVMVVSAARVAEVLGDRAATDPDTDGDGDDARRGSPSEGGAGDPGSSPSSPPRHLLPRLNSSNPAEGGGGPIPS